MPFPAQPTRAGPRLPLEPELPTRVFLTTAHLLHLMAAVLHQDRDLLELAIHQYEAALQLDPDRPDVLRNLGLALAEKGETEQARVTYERAFAINPERSRTVKEYGRTARRSCATPRARRTSIARPCDTTPVW